MKIFVADDSLMLREQITGRLAELDGVEIVGQATGASPAIERIGELKPDVVVLDIQLEGGSGIDVLTEIKRAESAPIVIIVTNSASPPYWKKCREAGADFFLDKSTEFSNLKEIIRGLLGQFDEYDEG